MWEMIEGMKVVIGDEVRNLEDLYDIQNNSEGGMHFCNGINNINRCGTTNTYNTIPLYTFPEKDKEGNMVWSGDIIQGFDKNSKYFLTFNGYAWEGRIIGKESIILYYGIDRDEKGKYFIDQVMKSRICSIFDPDCQEKTNLALEEIENLKQIMIGE